jgi:hypothetical protein
MDSYLNKRIKINKTKNLTAANTKPWRIYQTKTNRTSKSKLKNTEGQYVNKSKKSGILLKGKNKNIKNKIKRKY